MPPPQPPTALAANHQKEEAFMWNDGQSPRSPTLTPTTTNSIENNINSNVDWVTEADRYAEEVYTFDDDDKLDKFLFFWIDWNCMQ